MIGHIHSICSMSTKDGPGIRTVIFMQGCPLRCFYCHNPDTWQPHKGEQITPTELIDRISRFFPFFGKDGGITFSGGEPLMQPDFLFETLSLLKQKGIHTAIDTASAIPESMVAKATNMADLVMLDIKMNDEENYKLHTGGDLSVALDYLRFLDKANKRVWIRQVIVPKINDRAEDILRLYKLVSPFSCVERIELLPFRTLCKEKYDALGMTFPLEDTPEMTESEIESLIALLPERYR